MTATSIPSFTARSGKQPSRQQERKRKAVNEMNHRDGHNGDDEVVADVDASTHTDLQNVYYTPI